MRASLARRPLQPTQVAPALLDPRGARVILGERPALPARPIATSASALFGPRGACLASPAGPLIVCDTGHHRVLVWNTVPGADNTPADLVLGQPDFASEGPKALCMPTGVAVENGVLAIADAWHHRVLVWHELPARSNQPPDLVLDGLNLPYGVFLHDRALYVADTGNRRVLKFDGKKPLVLASELRWPHGIAVMDGRVLVADAGANRILGLDLAADFSMPYAIAVLADRLVVADTANSRLLGFSGEEPRLAGQKTFADKGENRWGFAARDSLCWPYGVSACGSTLVVADSGNNRVLLWEAA